MWQPRPIAENRSRQYERRGLKIDWSDGDKRFDDGGGTRPLQSEQQTQLADSDQRPRRAGARVDVRDPVTSHMRDYRMEATAGREGPSDGMDQIRGGPPSQQCSPRRAPPPWPPRVARSPPRPWARPATTGMALTRTLAFPAGFPMLIPTKHHTCPPLHTPISLPRPCLTTKLPLQPFAAEPFSTKASMISSP